MLDHPLFRFAVKRKKQRLAVSNPSTIRQFRPAFLRAISLSQAAHLGQIEIIVLFCEKIGPCFGH
jgi:hypothetical protein